MQARKIKRERSSIEMSVAALVDEVVINKLDKIFGDEDAVTQEKAVVSAEEGAIIKECVESMRAATLIKHEKLKALKMENENVRTN